MSEMSPVAPAGRAQDNGALARLTQIALLPVGVVLRLLDPPMRALQRVIGARHMAYVFLLPNFVFFGLFVFLPIGINVVFSVTGGTALFPSQRPYVGSDQFAYLFDCGSYFDPSSCREDHFWRGVANTAKFVVFQVAAMVLFSLITALVLNLKIRGRGFFRAVYFFPVLLSPVVVALIWKWILQRDGLLNAAITTLRRPKDPVLRRSLLGDVLGGVRLGLGAYGLLHPDPARRPAGDPRRSLRGRGDGRDAELARAARITLPLLWPNMIVVIVLALIKGAQTFDEVFVLTGGGPGTATLMVVQYIYETAFSNQVQNFGLAAAASVVLGVVLFVLTLLQFAAARRKEA